MKVKVFLIKEDFNKPFTCALKDAPDIKEASDACLNKILYINWNVNDLIYRGVAGFFKNAI